MALRIFDTHAAVKTLQAVGVDEPVAAAIVYAVRDSMTQYLIRKQDLAELKKLIVQLRTDYHHAKL